MKSSQRKKIIIGYRYDPQCYSSQRLHEVQTIQDQYTDEYLPIDSVKKTFQSDQKLIERLRNQNMLLRSQLQRLSSKSSVKSHQELWQQYQQLEKQSNGMRVQIQQLRNTVMELLERREVQREGQVGDNRILQEIDVAVRDEGRKMRLSSLARENYLGVVAQPQQEQGSYKAKVSNTHSNNHLPHQYQQQSPLYFPNNNLISPDYMYNDLHTVQSQKSHQQLQSQTQLGYNFSFMPRPLKRNISALQVLENSNNNYQNKRVTFNINEDKILFTSSSFKEMGNNKEVQTPNFASQSQQSLYGQENVGESVVQGKQLLNGLRKLPNKPERNQRTSNYSINVSDN